MRAMRRAVRTVFSRLFSAVPAARLLLLHRRSLSSRPENPGALSNLRSNSSSDHVYGACAARIRAPPSSLLRGIDNDLPGGSLVESPLALWRERAAEAN